MNTPFTKGKERRGVSVNSFVLPIIIILALMHSIVIILILSINTESSKLSQTMQEGSSYIEEATSLLGGSSLLSETASHFILRPINQKGELNLSPLIAYAMELPSDRRGSHIVEDFKEKGVSEDVMKPLSMAAENAEEMLEAQLHAIALVDSVYPIPDISPVGDLPLPSLKEEEEAMTPEEKQNAAAFLILSADYGKNKQSVSQYVGACTGVLKKKLAERSAFVGRKVGQLRLALWMATVAIIATLMFDFILFYRRILFPMKSFARAMSEDRPLNESQMLSEVKMLATSYNSLIRRRDSLEDILRSAAETDVLTHLPNRYSFEHRLMELEDAKFGVTILLFDVNYLKITNDQLGHAAGDKLLQKAGECIISCFGNDEKNNCFRIGGDEFASVLESTSSEQLEERIATFLKLQKQEHVSISWGSAMAMHCNCTNLKDLIRSADEELYVQKRKMHTDPDGNYIPSRIGA